MFRACIATLPGTADAGATIEWLPVALSLGAALAVGGLASAVLSIILSPRRTDLNFFEQQRRERLRAASPVYRWGEPLVDALAPLVGDPQGSTPTAVRRYCRLIPDSPPWDANEFLATAYLAGAVFGLVLGGLIALLAHPVLGLVAFAVCCIVSGGLSVGDISGKANRRLQQVKQRLPYSVDLMALMLDAGAGFPDCLTTAVRENGTHPLADELRQVVSDTELGRTRRDALDAFRERIDEDDVREFVFSVNKGEELGTPLSEIFRNQSEQMRLKRSQWAEKAAGRAQVQIVFPGLLIMVACMLIIAAPFLLKLLNQWNGGGAD